MRQYRHDMREANQDEVREILSAIKQIRLVVIFDKVYNPVHIAINVSILIIP